MFVLILLAFSFLFLLDMRISQVELKNSALIKNDHVENAAVRAKREILKIDTKDMFEDFDDDDPDEETGQDNAGDQVHLDDEKPLILREILPPKQ
jgi:hypothetical protein